jgi:hypothetical protein
MRGTPEAARSVQTLARTLSAVSDCNDIAVRCQHATHLILEETQHEPIHGRLPLAVASALWHQDSPTESVFVTVLTAASIMGHCFTLPPCSLKMQ